MAKSDTRKRFEEKFRTERAAGNKTFEFDGKTYSTDLAKEAPKKVPLPTPRPKDVGDKPMTLKDTYEKYPNSLPKKYDPRLEGFKPLPGKGPLKDNGFEPMPSKGPRESMGFESFDESPLKAGSGFKKGGMVKAKKSSVRGAGCATRGQGKGKMY
jgi:hypothetical protein